jgi:hypothetical protein
MAVDALSPTSHKTCKRQKLKSQWQEYCDAHYDDNNAAKSSPRLSALLDDPYRWWTEEGQKRFPIVYKMAMDHLSVPETPCDCERAFSTAKRTMITCDRNSLSPATIEVTQLQKKFDEEGRRR